MTQLHGAAIRRRGDHGEWDIQWLRFDRAAMTDGIDNLILDFVEWVARQERTYQETMDAWRTSCPRLTVWEDAIDRGLVEVACTTPDSTVRVTAAGLEFLQEKRPTAFRN